MNLSNLHMVYFLGIGGIGMSALARYFHQAGVKVAGYDRVKTDLTAELEKEGINIHYEDDPSTLPSAIDLVVITPAIPWNHNELNQLKNQGTPVLKRSEILGLLTQGKSTLAVAGTHGKTTVSSMLAHILHSSGIPISAFIGGIMKNYNSNVVLEENPSWYIVEADEYDRSFLTLNPEIAIITAMDADHLDIYGDHGRLREAFLEFSKKIPDGGYLVINEKAGQLPADHIHSITYGFSLNSQVQVESYRIEDHRFVFDASGPGDFKLHDVRLQTPGRFNIENALAAAYAAFLAGCSTMDITNALESYTGVKRRFDYRVRTQDTVYIDDYAHHPEELKACILAVKELYPGKKVTGIFQPHLFSRTRDFAGEFAASLELLDDVILLDIYPARELPIEGVDSGMILDKIKRIPGMICPKKDVPGVIAEKKPEVLLTLGAGDIDLLVEPLQQLLTKGK
ncbi:MAG: UDP-N-acetylmuramate--L-alanine ligase [Bacteroidetes bacterium]|nr:UDP-N-acetylmuramate--L-alanine ligase [Bacteroidota bacterium]